MKKQFLKIALVGIITACFLILVMGRVANAQWLNYGNYGNYGMNFGNLGWNFDNSWTQDSEIDEDELTRDAAWFDVTTGTSASGGTWISSQFGPDIGYGEQGTRYEYTDPISGMYTSYSTTGMGQAPGMAGMLPIYGGWNSAVGSQSYGPYAGGQNPSVQQTPFYDTQGYMSGSLFGPSTQAYQSQFNFMGGMLGSLFGTFGGYGGSNYSAGYGGYGGGGYAGYGGGGYAGYPQGMNPGNSGNYPYPNYF